MASINDLDLKQWKQHQDIWTDSLWMIDERDKTGGHVGDYHGNFVPQIPNQLIQRFTKKGDVVLDPFLGSGTTLIEARRLGRRGIGIELLPDVAALADSRLNQTSLLENPGAASQAVIIADSTGAKAKTAVLAELKVQKKQNVQLIILHPPYHDIIKFSDKKQDLSNAPTVDAFNKLFAKVVHNFLDLLEPKHYLAVVIGDKYTGGEWVPLSWMAMNEILTSAPELTLKSVIVKNMVNNRAKRNLENLWRYRALVGGFYIFKHEYILLFQKK